MAKDSLPDPELLRKLLRYEPETGKLFWKERPRELFKTKAAHKSWNTQHANTEAFRTVDSGGYWKSFVFRRPLKAHRVIWAMHHGAWPANDIDHINGDRLDNRIANLRDVTRSENLRNQKRPVTNTSGCVGVYWNRFSQRWMAQIKVHGNTTFLGRYDTFEEAKQARVEAEKEHGFHPNHGRSE